MGRPAKTRRFTAKSRDAFLDHLAETAHVGAACAAAGFSTQTAHSRRRLDPTFAQAWRTALLAGYDRIEAALIRKALGQSEPMAAGEKDGSETDDLKDDGAKRDGGAKEPATDNADKSGTDKSDAGKSGAPWRAEATGEIDISLAILLLGRHRNAGTGDAGGGALRAPRDTSEAALLAKLKGYAKREGTNRKAARAKADAGAPKPRASRKAAKVETRAEESVAEEIGTGEIGTGETGSAETGTGGTGTKEVGA